MDLERFLIEVCVDSMDSVRAAVEGGADRLELCANLVIGGTTPLPWLVREAAQAGVPVNVLVRPRFGDFLYTQAEKREQLDCIERLARWGASGAVVGALTADGALDVPFLAACREAAAGLHLTLHRAFDVCADAERALEQAIDLGFDTILTSGQRATAQAGAPRIAQLVLKARGRIAIMPGSGVNAANIAQIREATQAQAFHLSAKRAAASGMTFRREGVPMGLPGLDEYTRYVTDAQAVAAARAALMAAR